MKDEADKELAPDGESVLFVMSSREDAGHSLMIRIAQSRRIRLRDHQGRLRDHLGLVQGWESVC